MTSGWRSTYLIPGLLQTAEYTESILQAVVEFQGVPNDVTEGVAKRMERQQILYRRDHRFHFVVGEQALSTTVGNDRVMPGQFDRLLAVLGMPRVTFGIVPADAPYKVPISNFTMFDNRMVRVENVTAEMTITQPREVALYGRTFEVLVKAALTGRAARRLIASAVERRSQVS